jgi:hypothetical protein
MNDLQLVRPIVQVNKNLSLQVAVSAKSCQEGASPRLDGLSHNLIQSFPSFFIGPDNTLRLSDYKFYYSEAKECIYLESSTTN